jgi:ABC-type Fe3+-siderophore transport system permease subunit
VTLQAPVSRWLGRAALIVVWLGPVLGLLGPRFDSEVASFVIWQLRVPRVIAGLLVGASLGLAGAVTQALFRNPLATPDTTGTLAGATLGALLALVAGAGAAAGSMPTVTFCAFIGALGASAIVLAAAASNRLRTQDVLLIGIAVTLAATSLATALEDIADSPALVAASRWSLGHLSQIGYDHIKRTAPILLLCWVVLLSQVRPLQMLVLGEDLAHTRGLEVRRARVLSLGACSLLVATVVAWCGPIAFVGLIVPAIVRLALGANQRVVLPGSLLTGAALLSLCDALGRLISTRHELPVGVITAALGAPVLVILIALRNAR